MHEQSAIRPSIQTQHLQSGLARDLLSTHSKHSLTPGMNLQTELDAISSWGPSFMQQLRPFIDDKYSQTFHIPSFSLLSSV
jgi:hypothetical protein